MSFDKQLDIIVSILAGLVVFLFCLFWGPLPVKASLAAGAVVSLIGLLFGREVVKAITTFLP